ncbi:hypothetical protein SK128_017792 [Halocaridina rubra]|uniref:Uncharacterized protein n=1 Tax=Halocaridina rubra TaxID=373956 RepID=A0AAN8WV76_HALRR
MQQLRMQPIALQLKRTLDYPKQLRKPSLSQITQRMRRLDTKAVTQYVDLLALIMFYGIVLRQPSKGASKTNDSCEGWHRSFSELIGASDPTIWKF